MKKKLALSLATLLVVSAVATTVASAGGPTVVASGFGCNVYDGNGNLFVTTDSTLTVYASGKVVLKCIGNGAGAPDQVIFNFGNKGVACGMLQFGTTLDWSNKVGYNGNSQLTCTTFIHNNDLASASGGTAGIG